MAVAFTVVRVRIFLILFLIGYFQTFECSRGTCKSIGYRDIDAFDIAEQIRVVGIGRCARKPSFGKLERYRSTYLCIDGEVFYGQPAGGDFECFVIAGGYAYNDLVQFVEQFITDDFVIARQQLQLVATHAVFGVVFIVSVQYQSLGDTHAIVLHFDFHFLRFTQFVQFVCGTCTGCLGLDGRAFCIG